MHKVETGDFNKTLRTSREKGAFYEEGAVFGKEGLFRVREGAFSE